MPRYQAGLWFREDLNDEYYLSRHRHFGTHMAGVLRKAVETAEPLEAGQIYGIPLRKGELLCRILELQPSLFGDPGHAVLEPVFGIAPRHREEVFHIIDQLLALGWE